mgnify:CR=1 FL=1
MHVIRENGCIVLFFCVLLCPYVLQLFMGVDVMKKLKDSTVKARINSELKNSVDEKLLKVGLDSSTVIRMLYSYIEYYNKIPFDLNIPNIPNKKTVEVIEDIMEGRNLIEFSSIDELRKELDSEND